MRSSFLALLFCMSAPAPAYNGADLRWRTTQTEHFVIHFHQGLEFTASKTAAIADDVYANVTDLYGYQPPRKTHVVLRDDEDTANGFAAYNVDFITIWASPAQNRLRGKEDWIRSVLTHEFAHIVSLQASSRSGLAIEGVRLGGIQNADTRANVDVGGSLLILTHPYSRWWAEGTAQLDTHATGLDPWDTSRDMLLRSSVIENNLLTFDQMRNIRVRENFGPEQVYNQGFSFLLWIESQYGKGANARIARAAAGSMSPQFDRALETVTGSRARDLDARWRADLAKRYAEQLRGIADRTVEGEKIETVSPKRLARMPAAERPIEDGPTLAYPRFSPDGRWFSYVQRDQVVLRRLSTPFDPATDETQKPWVIRTSGRYYAWSPDSTRVVVSKRRTDLLGGNPKFDLYVWDLTDVLQRRKAYEAASERPRWRSGSIPDPVRITRGARATHPAWSPDGRWIAFSANEDGHRSLEAVRPDGSGQETWVQALGDAEAYDPAWSPDGSTLAYTFFSQRTTDVWLLDVATRSRRPLMLDAAEDREPVYSSDGRSIYFSSDRTGIFQLYRSDLALPGVATPISRVPTGAFMPAASPGGLLYARFSSYGFRAYRLDPSDADAPLALASFTDKDVEEKLRTEAFPAIQETHRENLWPRPLRIFPSFVLENGDIKRGFAFEISDRLERHQIVLSALFGREQDYQATYFNRVFVPTFFASYTEFVRYSDFSTFDDGDGASDDPKTLLRDRIRFIRAGISQDFRTRDFFEGSHLLSIDYERRAVDRRLGHPVLVGSDPLLGFRLIDNDAVDVSWNYSRNSRRSDRDSDINPRDQTELRLSYAWIHTSLNQPDGTIPAPNRSYFHHEASFLAARSFSLARDSALRWHSLWFRFNGGFKSRDVNTNDEFYLGGRLNFRAFGQIVPNTLLYGYEDFSISGETLLLLQTGYTFPIRRAIDRRWWILYLDGVYGSIFHEIGNAWDYGTFRNESNGEILLQSVGAEIRLKAFLFNDSNRWNTSLKVAHGFQDNAAHGFENGDSPVRMYLGIGTEF